MMKKFTILILIFYFTSNLFSQSIPPKRELRAAWIATVTNLDWPSSNGLTTDQQKQQLINLLDELKKDGINTVIFQVRSECDAMYSSAYDPWSYWLTGSQGTPPYPYYDPLEFAIEEAHKRGMELHAWFNPYRAERSVGNYTIAANHVTVQHPDWVLQIGTFKFLNPGLQAVRDYVTAVIYDVVSRYDVDGVHFDDYFYPYPPNNMTANSTNNALDDAAFASDPRGFTSKNDWRRDNVNILVQQVYDSIQSVKPWVKFGISPFGIWKNGVPTGITGLSAYDDIYCDAINWLHRKAIDYLTPQLYWPFGGGQDYGKLQPWWADSVAANGRHFYPGHAYYRISSWPPATEMPNQIRFDRSNQKVQGSVFFRAGNFAENPKGVTDSLRNDLYRYIAINPIMDWKDIIPPNPIQNLRFEKLANGQAGLKWDLPQTASDGDSAYRYVVYRFDNSNISSNDLDSSQNIINVEGSRQSIPDVPPSGVGHSYFVVTALDRNYNESSMSEILNVTPPSAPVLVSPLNSTPNTGDTLLFKWTSPTLSTFFQLQISTDSSFQTDIVLDQKNLVDTFKVIYGLNGQTKYFWRVSASNAGGTSEFSAPFSFTTGYPASTLLAYPLNNTGDIPRDTTLYWHSTINFKTYDLMLARAIDFNPTSIIVDVKDLTDTSYNINSLLPYTFYFWKVRALNEFGVGNWSDIWRFRTVSINDINNENISVNEYILEQNYPNPFNPTTTIRIQVAAAGLVTLKIYNLLGQEVASLINDYLTPGAYNFKFDASNLSSGVYLYRIRVNDFSASKKMILLK
jgi:uncharacterized lipoprotein YddW (UPF0748 family)